MYCTLLHLKLAARIDSYCQTETPRPACVAVYTLAALHELAPRLGVPPECALCCAGQSVFCVKAASLCVHERGFSFFSVKRAQRETLATFTTLKRTPGILPTEWPLRPNPEINTSSCEKHTEPTV